MINANQNKSACTFALCFFIAYLAASLIFYPSVLLNGRIWGEEARDFLIPIALDAKSPLDAILYLHKAHLDLFPNIATFLSLILPVKYTPYIYSWTALIPVAIFSSCFGYTVSRTTDIYSRSKGWYSLIGWICAIGFLASCGIIGIESHLNTINSWSFIVASVALLIPLNQSRSTSKIASILVSVSPILAFPCVLFSPWLLAQFLASNSRKIKIQNICFFASCIIQVVLPKLVPSGWIFGDGRCFEARDIISIIPTLIIKNFSPLVGNIHAFKPISGSLISSYFSLYAITISSIVAIVLCAICNRKAVTISNFKRLFRLDSTFSVTEIVTGLIPPIIIWQIFAIASVLAGAYGQLMMGGGYRYSNSLYLVFLTITSILFASSVKTTHQDLSEKKKGLQLNKESKLTNKSSQIKLVLITWLSIMIIVTMHEQNARYSQSDFWCFTSSPDWPYRDHNEFKKALKTPSLILTCPIGWSNETLSQKAKTKQDKLNFCKTDYST
jgi:hypothetical protein